MEQINPIGSILEEGIAMSNHKNEAVGFKSAIKNSTRVFHGDDEDVVWDIILKHALEDNYNVIGVNGYDDFQVYEAPFVNNERPDLYYLNDGFIVGIEQFRFDSSKKTKKGSKLVKEKIRVDEEILKEYYAQGISPFSTEIVMDVQLSYSNYVHSLLDVFCQHKKSILEYRKNLEMIAPGKKVYLAFYIEDTTPLGNYIMTAYGRETLNPLCVKELIDELAECSGLDYVVTRVQRDYIYTLHIQQVKDEYIQSLYKESYDARKDIFLPYKTIVTSHIG
jgi:hypothetical protein